MGHTTTLMNRSITGRVETFQFVVVGGLHRSSGLNPVKALNDVWTLSVHVDEEDSASISWNRLEIPGSEEDRASGEGRCQIDASACAVPAGCTLVGTGMRADSVDGRLERQMDVLYFGGTDMQSVSNTVRVLRDAAAATMQ
ncbi:hypothetical protein HDU82_007821 [Entophlyctis luteolus]|nr:hypothetical protein HDU82_007821 [Entophlyctis luteolus]